MANRNKTIGLLLILVAPILMIACLTGYALSNTLFHAGLAESASSTQTFTIVNIVISILGFIATLGVFIGVPLGIYLLVKKDPNAAVVLQKMDKRSGLGAQSIIPDEIKHWNWGAAGLTWIWGSYYSVWISFLMWISPISLFWWIVLGIHGSEWAWRNHAWASVAEFQAAQDKWKPWGILFVVFRVLFFGLFLLIMFATIGSMTYSMMNA